MSYSFCGCLLACSHRTCMTWCYMYSLRLLMMIAETFETCRVLFQNKINLRFCASCWFYYRNILRCMVLQTSNPCECYAVCCSVTYRRFVQNVSWSSGIYWTATDIRSAWLVDWQSHSLNCSFLPMFSQLNQILNKFYTSLFLPWTTTALVWIVTPWSSVIIYRPFRETLMP
jgi:hypothetical protein